MIMQRRVAWMSNGGEREFAASAGNARAVRINEHAFVSHVIYIVISLFSLEVDIQMT